MTLEAALLLVNELGQGMETLSAADRKIVEKALEIEIGGNRLKDKLRGK